jgi:hypothetical protein
MARVGIDLDGVGYDFSGSVYRYLKQIDHELVAGVPTAPESVRWEFYEDWGLNLHEFLEHVNAGVDHGVIFTGPARPGFIEGLQMLKSAGHTIVIVTDRRSGTGDNAKKNTFDWLAEHNIPYDELHFDSDKTAYECEFFIEDKPENYLALDKVGCEVYLVDRPWNSEFAENEPGVRRVDGVRDFARVVNDRLLDVKGDAAVVGSGEIRTTSSTGGQKGVKLARFDLIPPDSLWKLAEVYGAGGLKYADRNWENGYEWSKSYAAMMRHANQFWQGIDDDEELSDLAGVPINHIAQVIWHATNLQHFYLHPDLYKHFDDRPVK